MKALTLHQPWASLIALGVKTVETRSWSTAYRGPLAIHAAKRKPDVEMMEDGPAGELYDESNHDDAVVAQWWATDRRDYDPARVPAPEDRWSLWTPKHDVTDLPLGRVVATCELVDVVPILLDTQPWEGAAVTATSNRPPHYLSTAPYPSLVRWPGGEERGIDVSDQRPYGDFRPGRFAWALDNVQRLEEPVPAKGAQGLWEWKP